MEAKEGEGNMQRKSADRIISLKVTEKVVDEQKMLSEDIRTTHRNYYPSGEVIKSSEHSKDTDNVPKVVAPSTTVIDTTTAYTDNNTEDYNNHKMSSSSAERNETNNNNTAGGGGDNNVMVEANGTHADVPDNAQLISRTTQQVKTQQVKTVTKVYTTREVRHFGPDGQPIEPVTTGTGNYENAPPVSVATSAANTTNEYSNFPGPKVEGAGGADLSAGNFNDYNPHYSNTGFGQLQPPPTSSSSGAQQPSPSPGSGSTANTGSTAVAASFVNTQTRLQYDPYTVNSQIGYPQPQHQDYSNINNYQDLAHLNELAAAAAAAAANGQALPPGASPQPPIRRHGPGAHPTGEEAFVQTPQGPIAYGYAPGPGGQPLPMHSPGQAIYTNYEEAPQGYLDRRPTYDDHGTYGQMLPRGAAGPPMPPGGQMVAPAMYEDAEAAYQHLHALQAAAAAASMDPAAMFFQNGLMASMRAGGGAGAVGPGPSNVAIGPDGVRWRDPDLPEVIEFLRNGSNSVRANAAAYLQHLCFMDDSMKAKTRALGGIPALVNLLKEDVLDVQRNACGALRNLSYGRQNDENKRTIRAAGGIGLLVRLLRKTPDNDVRELVTSILWNLSSCEDLKRPIIDEALQTLVDAVIIPHSGWNKNAQPQQQQQHPQQYWPTVFRNASGVLRNVSSSGEYARRRLRECEGLVDSLLLLVRAAVGKCEMDNKSVENCVCVLRNLSYRCQEVVDPEYDKNPPQGAHGSPSRSGVSSSPSLHAVGGGNGPSATSSTLSPSSSSSSKNSTSSLMGLGSKVGENLSCFGGLGKKKSKPGAQQGNRTMSPSGSMSLESRTATLNINGGQKGEAAKGMELLWQTEVVQPYLALLSECSNPETLEAAAGAIQNLAACYWQPSIDIRGAVRKEKGLPILVELLRMEVDRVVCAVATALRNLAMDPRNKELIGKYALKDLVSKLPTPSASGLPLEMGTSDDTIAAVLATLNEVVAKNPDFAKSLLEAGGMQRLTLVIKHRTRFSTRVVKFTSQLLYNMWQHSELREVYKKAGWKESHFLVPTPANATPGRGGGAGNTGTLRSQHGQNNMSTSASSLGMHTPSSPTSNGGLGGGNNSSLYQSIGSANNTLSRPMSTVGGTKYEDQQQQALARGALARQSQMLQQRMHEEMLMAEMGQQQQQQQQFMTVDGATAQLMNGTMVRPPVGGVPIFPMGGVPGEPVYAQVNRERKRQQQAAAAAAVAAQQQQQQQQQHSPLVRNQDGGGGGGNAVGPGNTSAETNGTTTAVAAGGNSSNYSNVMLDPSNNEPIYPPSMPAGDSWV